MTYRKLRWFIFGLGIPFLFFFVGLIKFLFLKLRHFFIIVFAVALYTQQGNVFLWKDYFIQQDFFSRADQVCTFRQGLIYCIPASEIKYIEKNSPNAVFEIKDVDRGIKIKGVS